MIPALILAVLAAIALAAVITLSIRARRDEPVWDLSTLDADTFHPAEEITAEPDPLDVAQPLFAPDLEPALFFDELMAQRAHGFAEEVERAMSWNWSTAEYRTAVPA